MSTTVPRTLRLCHLYPDEMNIYADRGNIAVLRRRLEWRGMALEVVNAGIGDGLTPGAHDLYYLGGGQDRDQAIVAEDLARTKGAALISAVDDGAALLAVCGGYQLAGRGYVGVDGSSMPGIGLLDAETVAGPTRLIGDVLIAARLDDETREVAGFENHAGRTRLGPGATPFGTVLAGFGNDGESGHEGVVRGRAIGTYLHGPLLPRNPWVADTLLAWGLSHALAASVRVGEIVHLGGRRQRHGGHHQLGDAVADRDVHVVCAQVHEDHLELAAVARVDQPGGVGHGEPMPKRVTRARHHQTGHSGRDGHRPAGWHGRPRAGREREVLDRRQVEPRITGMSALRQGRQRAQPAEWDVRR